MGGVSLQCASANTLDPGSPVIKEEFDNGDDNLVIVGGEDGYADVAAKAICVVVVDPFPGCNL
jgi:hypothetical protein